MQIVNPTSNYANVNLTEVLYVSDSKLTLCPVGTYLGSDFRCYQNPIETIIASIYPKLINSELNYVFSSNETTLMSSTAP